MTGRRDGHPVRRPGPLRNPPCVGTSLPVKSYLTGRDFFEEDMTAYYNENAPKAAAWLREFRPIQVREADSASYPEGYGMSDKVPTPCLATCNSQNCAMPPCANVLVYDQRLRRAPRHNTHMPVVHLGSFCKTERDYYLATSYSSFALGISPAARACGYGMFEQKVRLTPFDTLKSRSTYYAGRDQFRSSSRTRDIHVASRHPLTRASSDACPYNGLSNISDGCGFPAFRCRTQHSGVAQ